MKINNSQNERYITFTDEYCKHYEVTSYYILLTTAQLSVNRFIYRAINLVAHVLLNQAINNEQHQQMFLKIKQQQEVRCHKCMGTVSSSFQRGTLD